MLTATFSLLVTNQSAVTYQWRVNGTNLAGPGAVKSVLTRQQRHAAINNGQVYRCVVANASGSVTSAPAILTVIADTNPPTLVSAVNSGLDQYRRALFGAGGTCLGDESSNYAVAPGVSGFLGRVSGPQTCDVVSFPLSCSSSNYTVTVNDVRDLAGTPNTIAANSQISFTVQAYGLESHPAIGPFLNNQMPEAAPVISGNWSAVVAFTNLTFTNALGLAAMPGTNRLVVWEREGRVYSFINDPSVDAKDARAGHQQPMPGLGRFRAAEPGVSSRLRDQPLHVSLLHLGHARHGCGQPDRPARRRSSLAHIMTGSRGSRWMQPASPSPAPNWCWWTRPATASGTTAAACSSIPTNGFLYSTDGDDERSPTRRSSPTNSFPACLAHRRGHARRRDQPSDRAAANHWARRRIITFRTIIRSSASQCAGGILSASACAARIA